MRIAPGQLLERVERGVETSQLVLCGLEHGLCAGAAVAVFPCGWTWVLDHKRRTPMRSGSTDSRGSCRPCQRV